MGNRLELHYEKDVDEYFKRIWEAFYPLIRTKDRIGVLKLWIKVEKDWRKCVYGGVELYYEKKMKEIRRVMVLV